MKASIEPAHYLEVAGFTIRLIYTSADTQRPGSSLMPFICAPTETPDISIRVHEDLPAALSQLKDEPMLSKGTLNGEMLWSLGSYKDGYLIRTFEHFDPSDLQFTTTSNREFNEFDAYPLNRALAANTDAIYPLSFPLLSLILYYQTTRHDALFIHASGINDNSKGRIFSAVSGVGKTTISRLWSESGYPVINDDRLMIRRSGDTYTMHNTPMMYTTQPRSCTLSSIYLLKQAPEFRLSAVTGAASVSRVMANCIIQAFDNQVVQHHLDFISDMCTHIPVMQLENRPELAVIPFIQQHEAHAPHA